MFVGIGEIQSHHKKSKKTEKRIYSMPSAFVTIPLTILLGIVVGMLALVLTMYDLTVKELKKTIREQQKKIDELVKTDIKI